MRICFLFLVALSLMFGVAHADIVHLKNGNSVEGKIVEKTDDGIKVDIGGITLTYYADEIASIDAAQASAPAAQEAAAASVPEAPVQEEPAASAPEVPAVQEPAAVSVSEIPVAEEPAVAPAPEIPAAQEPAVPVASETPAATAPAVMDELTGMTKADLIKKFVEIYGVKENMQANFDQMTATLKPDQAEAFRQAVKVDDIVELLFPIYDKHFSEDDLRAYIRFYSSAEGKKLVQTLPLLMKDSVDVSMKYLDTHLPESLKQQETAPAGN